METRFLGSGANGDYNNFSVVSQRVEIKYATSLRPLLSLMKLYTCFKYFSLTSILIIRMSWEAKKTFSRFPDNEEGLKGWSFFDQPKGKETISSSSCQH